MAELESRHVASQELGSGCICIAVSACGTPPNNELEHRKLGLGLVNKFGKSSEFSEVRMLLRLTRGVQALPVLHGACLCGA